MFSSQRKGKPYQGMDTGCFHLRMGPVRGRGAIPLFIGSSLFHRRKDLGHHRQPRHVAEFTRSGQLTRIPPLSMACVKICGLLVNVCHERCVPDTTLVLRDPQRRRTGLSPESSQFRDRYRNRNPDLQNGVMNADRAPCVECGDTKEREGKASQKKKGWYGP